jgi:hypothetical protein
VASLPPKSRFNLRKVMPLDCTTHQMFEFCPGDRQRWQLKATLLAAMF